MTTLHLDFETRSLLDLTKVGVYNYATHFSTDVWMACWALDDGEVQTWYPGEPLPFELAVALADPEVEVAGHNAGFEWHIIEHILSFRYGWSRVDPKRLNCTAARAAAVGLPRALGAAAQALRLDVAKDGEGRKLMLQMAKPRKIDKNCDFCFGTGLTYADTVCGCVTWWDTPDRVARLTAYCATDVEVERAIDITLPRLSAPELALWRADFASNRRGVMIDRDLVNEALALVDLTMKRYDQEMAEITSGAVAKVSDAGGLVKWLQAEGVDTNSVAKDVVLHLLDDPEVPERAKAALRVRQAAGKSSLAKLPAFLLRVSDDDRMRELLRYHGAMPTGRWAGQGPQLHNLPRPSRHAAPALAIPIIKDRSLTLTERAARLELLLGPVPEVISDCIRGCLIAAPGNVLRVADYSNIEGRVAAWLGDEEWKLAAFRAFDAGTGPDLYRVAGGGIFGVDPASLDDHGRQIGKVSELSLQFQGGVGAAMQMAANYHMDWGAYYDHIMGAADPFFIEAAREAWASFGKASGVPERTWLAAETVKRAWRAKHPGIVAMWYACDEASINAMKHPGQEFTAGRLRYIRPAGSSFLLCILPSGRRMCYPDPHLTSIKTPWGDLRQGITYMAIDSQSGRRVRSPIYGGMFFQHATQGLARDLMAGAYLRVEAAGYPIVLTVHDEMINESAANDGSYEEFAAIMRHTPRWATGIPIAVNGFEAPRYRKD